MNNTKFNQLFKNKKPLIGMVHLPALLGYPKHPGMEVVIKKALIDLKTLEKAGFDGVLVENDNDQPHQIGVNPTIKEAFKNVMEQVVKKSQIPVGMEIIYDMLATVEVASQVKADFVRLDVFVDNVETRWGKILAQAKEIINLKEKLRADSIILLTDIHVKHARILDSKSLSESAKEALKNNSNGLVVTGNWTGEAPTLQDCIIAKNVSGNIPVVIGSGLSTNNAIEFLKVVDGAIIGTSIKSGEYVDLTKAKDLVKIARDIRSSYD